MHAQPRGRPKCGYRYFRDWASMSFHLVRLSDVLIWELRTCCSGKRKVLNERVVLCPENEKYYVACVSLAPHALSNAELAFAPRSERVNPPIGFDTRFRPFPE